MTTPHFTYLIQPQKGPRPPNLINRTLQNKPTQHIHNTSEFTPKWGLSPQPNHTHNHTVTSILRTQYAWAIDLGVLAAPPTTLDLVTGSTGQVAFGNLTRALVTKPSVAGSPTTNPQIDCSVNKLPQT